jgi:protein Mpv17
LIAQTCELQSSKTKKNYDWNRFLQFFLKGIGCGLIWSSWYKVAEGWSSGMSTRAVSLLAPSSTNVARSLYKVIQTVSSILLEQFLACPIIYGFWDIPVLTLLKGKPLKSVPNEVKTKLGRLLVANAKMWTAANIIIYNVPLKWRVVALSGADMIWQSIISTNIAKRTDEEEVGILHESLEIAKDAARR